MRVLLLYDYPPPPGGLATQGDLLFRGLKEIGVDAMATHLESDLEKEWTYLAENNYVTYTNLFPGNYIFEIKSTDKTREGIPTRLAIRIQSPWYLSWYAYIVYVIIVNFVI